MREQLEWEVRWGCESLADMTMTSHDQVDMNMTYESRNGLERGSLGRQLIILWTTPKMVSVEVETKGQTMPIVSIDNV